MSGTTYEEPSADALKYLQEARTTYHEPRLDGVRVGMLFAFAPVDEETGDRKGDALKRHGVPCLAIARIVPTKDRVAGMPDAMVYVDGDAWAGLTRSEKLALLDHELTHFTFPENRGEDCHGRPKLKMRQHDHEFGWFDDVAERHRQASQEVQQARRFVDGYGQLYLLGGEDDPAAETMEVAARPTKAVAAKSARAHDRERPDGMQVADELVVAIGKIKHAELIGRVEDLHSIDSDSGEPLLASTIAALLWAESSRPSSKQRTTLLGFLEKHAGDIDPDDLKDHGEAARWAALLLCHSTAAPKLEHVEAGIPVIVDLAMVRHVQSVELARKKKARARVVDLCEERIGQLLEQEGGAS